MAAKSSGPANYNGHTLTVWIMQGDDQQQWMDSVRADFQKAYPGADVSFQVQQWSGIQQNLSIALASVDPPDVVDIGNTQTSYYASTGGLLDLGPYLDELGRRQWTESMNKSTLYQGKQYAAPWYAGNRVVLYNKDLWAKAGLTSVPKTRAQWLSDLSKLQNTAGVSSALWLPGQNWYAFDGFLQDEGAQLVKKDTASGTWTGNLETPAAIRAVQFFKQLQSYGNAPKDQDEAHPIQADRFAQGDIASMIAMGWEGEEAVKKNPKLAGKLGWFPIPGRTADKPAATFLGGSNLGVALNTRQKELAIGFLKIALDDRNEALFAKASGFLPNRASLVSALKANPYGQAAAQAIDEAGYTPLVPTWGNVEASPNPIVTKFLTPYLQGKVSAAQGAEAANAVLSDRLSWQ
ncbi:extracellular solute-binding protein [Streptacidiphilus monticola]|uniref:Extracellular solute-binding protein n=1 Tax=Streptacidiphilus monticola TaxID=2161674 RepID=A0ABW1G0M4_9ACTN